MKILQTEIYKICTRKILYLGLFAGLLFLGFYFWTGVLGGEYVYEDGICYRRMEAIEKNLEAAKNYEGPLTREKAEDIIDTFGWTEYADNLKTDPETGDTKKGYYENACNRFVTESLSTRRWGAEFPALVRAQDVPEISALMDGGLEYAYGDVWGSDFLEMHMMARLILAVLTVIAAAPVFSEEYALGTVNVLMTTEYGRGKNAVCKAGAVLGLTGILYLAVSGALFALFAGIYGTEGLRASGELVFPDLYYMGASRGTAGGLLLRYLLAGFLANIGTGGITLFISSRCRQTFKSLLWSLFFYVLPLIMYSIILTMLGPSGTVILLRGIIGSLTLFMPMAELSSASAVFRWSEYGIVAVVTVFCVLKGCRRYSRYQIT